MCSWIRPNILEYESQPERMETTRGRRTADARKYEGNSPKFPMYDPLSSWHLSNRNDRIRRETFNCTRRLGKRPRGSCTNPLFHQSLRGGSSSCQTSGNLYAASSPLPEEIKTSLRLLNKSVIATLPRKFPLKHAGRADYLLQPRVESVEQL